MDFSVSDLPFSYSHLPSNTTEDDASASTMRRRPSILPYIAFGSFMVLLLVAIAMVIVKSPINNSSVVPETISTVPVTGYSPRGVKEGVSEKSSGVLLASDDGSPVWTNEMLSWQRSEYHFQPEKNWMNDPNGVMYYNGWYHLFYQYNPDSAAWGNITWGHAISRDLITWFHLPLAMVIDHWYDANGVWSGSATVLPDGRVVMLYTGSAEGLIQVQNLAVPANLSDPLLIDWVKSDANPILFPPPGTGPTDFRDPTTAWYVPEESAWRIVIGSKDVNHNGLSLTYRTKDFVNYELIPTVMHVVPGTGMWECIDFYPVSTTEASGLETSANGPGIKHVLKASLEDDMHDYYAIGSYDVVANVWLPDDPESDVGIGLRLDYGKFYASKTFYDPIKERRVLWGWTGESDSELADIRKGWASLQSIPRTVTFDSKTKANLLLWPVEEVENLRTNAKNFENIKVAAGSVVPLNVGQGTQLDVVAEFEVRKEALKATTEADVGYNCSTSGGSAGRGALGPFGFLVLADDKFSEQTAVYFYVARGVDGNLRTFICQDELRSSIANDITKTVYGTTIPVIDGEKLSLRILVDHSIVETFAQGGRRTITSRVYPTKAIYGEAKLFLFNNATGADVIATSVKVWQMKSALIRRYNFQNQTANGS